MKIYRSIRGLKRVPAGSVVTVGVFDGVHRGHGSVLKTLTGRARRLKKKSVVLTFFPHPASILHPDRPVPLLISLRHRLRLMEEYGVDIVMLMKFSARFSRMEAEPFIKEWLIDRLGMAEMVVGSDFCFGRAMGGDTALLERLGRKYGFAVRKAKPLCVNGRPVSSTYIRTLITQGEIDKAAHILGRPVAILGTVKEGTGRGRFLGFPTANINPHHEAIPPSGVYAVRVKLGAKEHIGIMNIGFRPTFQMEGPCQYLPEPTVEVHIFDFKGDIYGQNAEVILVKRIRSERRFKDGSTLRRQITRDAEAAREILRSGVRIKKLG